MTQVLAELQLVRQQAAAARLDAAGLQEALEEERRRSQDLEAELQATTDAALELWESMQMVRVHAGMGPGSRLAGAAAVAADALPPLCSPLRVVGCCTANNWGGGRGGKHVSSHETLAATMAQGAATTEEASSFAGSDGGEGWGSPSDGSGASEGGGPAAQSTLASAALAAMTTAGGAPPLVPRSSRLMVRS